MLLDTENPSKYILLKRSFFCKDYMKLDNFPVF